ncbi:MAG: DUF1932 domain-containing protein [Albidovulum sp.]|nr:DUF1932 domain-containing protein [Albidovulum sp.]
MAAESQMLRVLLLGFGEAGQAFAKGWRQTGAGIELSTYDVKFDAPGGEPELLSIASKIGVRPVSHGPRAFSAVDHVFSLVTADRALEAARSAARFLSKPHVFWDLNSVAPSTKRAAAAAIATSGADYLDVGVLAPVFPCLHRTRLALAGPMAASLGGAIGSLDLNAEVFSETIGDAATLKLLRSIVIKGIEASVAECMLACCIADMKEDVLNSLAPSFPGIDWLERAEYIAERIGKHGRRRAEEMREAAKMLEEFGIDPVVSRAAAARLRQGSRS